MDAAILSTVLKGYGKEITATINDVHEVLKIMY
jgi:hypothetical protein